MATLRGLCGRVLSRVPASRPVAAACVQARKACNPQLRGRSCLATQGSPWTGALLQGCDDGQREQLAKYLTTLFEWNEHINLIGPTTKDQAWERHVADSLALLPVMDQYIGSESKTSAVRLLDVGSGAGLPGLVLAIARPSWRVVLLDSLSKRARFLEAAAAACGADNVSVVCAKAEDAARRADMRGAFAVVTARAVAEVAVLAELCLPFAAVGGTWVAAKGPEPGPEVARGRAAIALLGGRLLDVVDVESAAPHGRRTAVVVRKIATTPERYPRAPGRPNKRPLA